METHSPSTQARGFIPAKLTVLGLSDLSLLASENERAHQLVVEGRARYSDSPDAEALWEGLQEDLDEAAELLRVFAFPTTSARDVNMVPEAPAARAGSFNYVAHNFRIICFLVELAHARRSGTFSVEWLRASAPPVLDGEAPWQHLLREAGEPEGAAPLTGSSPEGHFLRIYRPEALQQLGAFASLPLFTQRCARFGPAVVRIAGIAFLHRLLRHAENLQGAEHPDAQQLSTAHPLLRELCELLIQWHPLEPISEQVAPAAQACLAALGFTPPGGGWSELAGT